MSRDADWGQRAGAYSVSAAHRSGESLAVLAEFASGRHYRWAVDVGTGVGFTAFAVAPYCDLVLATDSAPGMLEEARREAARRKVGNVGLAVAVAEALPFAPGSLPLVTCRTAAHHFRDLEAAVREWYRALEPGGTLLLADTVTPEDPETARWMNDVELRRDPTHVYDLRPSEWLALLERHGFQVASTALTDSWVARTGVAPEEAAKLRKDFLEAPAPIRGAFAIRQEQGQLRFRWDCLVVRAEKW
ncbi:MAG: class I SAM-dependent methyltransferase [Chloroflexi bacterium]|nr:class I SAM-dependent methyltransferase [Chloroflexota bacterium]